MASYALNAIDASLLITDTPVGYAPPLGPPVWFTVRYDARQSLQPSDPPYGHLGPQWTHDWLSYAQEEPAWCEGGLSGTNYCYPATVFLYLRGGGREEYDGADANGVYPRHWRVRAQLVRVSTTPIRYERQLADGGIEIYGVSDAAPAGERRVFLSEVRDARGHAVTLTYDADFRLVALTDALGQVTTLSYERAETPRQITRVTDPFGRAAAFAYNAASQLTAITDTIGLTSSMTYAANDFIAALTTPYGTTTFRQDADYWNPMIEATLPTGGVERLEFRWETTAWSATEPASEVPTAFSAENAQLDTRTTVYWSPQAWATAPGDVSAATRTHWLMGAYHPYATLRSIPVPHSIVRPGDGRTWYRYPGQSSPQLRGTSRTASEVARVLDDGTTQRTLTTLNEVDHVTSRTDPVGRQTSYTYAANGRDLLQVRQITGGANELLATYGDYTATGQPQTITDAAGQTTSLTYDAAGHVLTVTNPRNETTTHTYNGAGQLAGVTGPVSWRDDRVHLRWVWSSPYGDGGRRHHDHRVQRLRSAHGSVVARWHDRSDDLRSTGCRDAHGPVGPGHAVRARSVTSAGGDPRSGGTGDSPYVRHHERHVNRCERPGDHLGTGPAGTGDAGSARRPADDDHVRLSATQRAARERDGPEGPGDDLHLRGGRCRQHDYVLEHDGADGRGELRLRRGLSPRDHDDRRHRRHHLCLPSHREPRGRASGERGRAADGRHDRV